MALLATLLPSLAQYGSTPGSGTGGSDAMAGVIGILFFVAYIGVIILVIAGMWKALAKGGQPGWGAIIPIVNGYFLAKLAGRPGWWVILLMLPVVSLIFWIIVCNDIAKAFGRGTGTTLGLIFLPFIFFPILGFGSAEYQGPGGALEDHAPLAPIEAGSTTARPV